MAKYIVVAGDKVISTVAGSEHPHEITFTASEWETDKAYQAIVESFVISEENEDLLIQIQDAEDDSVSQLLDALKQIGVVAEWEKQA